MPEAQAQLTKLCRGNRKFVIANRYKPAFAVMPVADDEALVETLDLPAGPVARKGGRSGQRRQRPLPTARSGDIKALAPLLDDFHRLRIGSLRDYRQTARERLLEYADSRDRIYEIFQEIVRAREEDDGKSASHGAIGMSRLLIAGRPLSEPLSQVSEPKWLPTEKNRWLHRFARENTLDFMVGIPCVVGL